MIVITGKLLLDSVTEISRLLTERFTCNLTTKERFGELLKLETVKLLHLLTITES